MDLLVATGQRRQTTDNVPNDPSLEPTHFKGDGLRDAADAWSNAIIGPGKLLNSTSQPITVASLGTSAQSLALSADGQTLVAPAGNSFRWVDEVAGRIDINQPISSVQTTGSGRGGGVPVNAAASTTSGFRRAVVQNANGNFIITQAVPYPFDIVDDTQPPTDACSSFTDGTDVAYRAIGDPNVKVRVQVRGNCKYAVWSDGSEDMPYNWMPYVNTIGTFTKEAMRQCLTFNGETCTTAASCNLALAPTIADGNANRACGQAVTLNANCSGSDCGAVSYSWSGNGISGNGSSVSFNVPGTAGSYGYSVTASKAGCANQTNAVSINVSCGGGNPTTCIEAETGQGTMSVQNNANASGGQFYGNFGDDVGYVNYPINVPTAGNYTIRFTYSYPGGPVRFKMLVNNGSPQVVDLPASPAWYDFVTNSATVALPAGNSTLTLRGISNYFVMLDKFCIQGGTGGSCNVAVSPSIADGNANRACSQSVTLNANCSGSDCSSVSYSWSGNGIGANSNGSSVSFNVPNANGSYTYTVTASKAGCANQTNAVSVNVSCGGGGPDCSSYTNGAQVAYRALGDPNVKVVVQVRGNCKYAVWSNSDGDMPRDWLPYVTANPGFSTTTMGTCLKFAGDACGARLAADEPTQTEGLDLRVAPNPSNGRFTVHFQTKLGETATLRLSDLNGRAVRATQTIMGTGGEHAEAIVLPASVHGVLLIDVVSGGQRAGQKIIID